MTALGVIVKGEVKMKKLIFCIGALIFMASFAGCGEKETAEIRPAENTAQAETAELDEKTAKTLTAVLNTIDRLGACAVPCDENSKFTAENGDVYYRVTDPELKSTEDIRSLTDKYLTAEFVSRRYSNLLGTERPVYIDENGGLYVLYEPKGGGFAFSEREPVIEKTGEGEYTVTAEYDNYGGLDNLRIYIVRDGGNFKINNIEF